MSTYNISTVYKNDSFSNKKIDFLMRHEGINRDKNLDYTCAIFDDDFNAIATGSLFKNTLRCLAVRSDYQGEGLLNQIVSHLIEKEFSRGNHHLFLYTKFKNSKFFEDLGFYPVAKVKDEIVFLENSKEGFSNYLSNLSKSKAPAKNIASIVMNANPFTKGHLYLVEKSSKENDIVHLFMVSEDSSLVPYQVRKKLIMEGTKHLNNIVYHDSGPYIISNATFPSYFQKDEEAVIRGHALLDLTIFKSIAETLSINKRYVGEESLSHVTSIYNNIMAEELPKAGVDCIIVPRKEFDGEVISASRVRSLIHSGKIDEVKNLLPKTTYDFLKSEEGKQVIERIQNADDVIHY